VLEAPFDEARDATRRTRLANERTHLAWWRTGLTALAVSFGAGKLLPALTDSPAWARPAREVERALREGRFAPISAGVAAAFTFAGLLLSLGTVLLLFFAR
jgi:inner membrane protein YidH